MVKICPNTNREQQDKEYSVVPTVVTEDLCSFDSWVACSLDDLRSFFCQAEDGIRGKLVTGVQTCALPISTVRATSPNRARGRGHRLGDRGLGQIGERRVGKECRSRWSPYHRNKKHRT